MHEGEGRIFSNYSSSVLASHLSAYQVSDVVLEYVDPIGVFMEVLLTPVRTLRGDRRASRSCRSVSPRQAPSTALHSITVGLDCNNFMVTTACSSSDIESSIAIAYPIRGLVDLMVMDGKESKLNTSKPKATVR